MALPDPIARRAITHTRARQHMRAFAGSGASVEFTHLSRAAGASLTASFLSQASEPGVQLANASCHTEAVLDLMKSRDVALEQVCLLDPRGEAELSPEDGERFSWFLFGVCALEISVSPFVNF